MKGIKRMLERLIEKITHKKALEDKIETLSQRIMEMVSFTALCESRLNILEKDRDECFKCIDEIRAHEEALGNLGSDLSSKIKRLQTEFAAADRVNVLEHDRDVLFERIDEAGAHRECLESFYHELSEEIQNIRTELAAADRVNVLEHDRDELFKRIDEVGTHREHMEGLCHGLNEEIEKVKTEIAVVDQVSVLERDRDELFKRIDQVDLWKVSMENKYHALREKSIACGTADRMQVLEKDRDELFKRIDDVREIIDRNEYKSDEQIWAAEIAVRDSLDNVRRQINPCAERSVVHFIRTLDMKNVGDQNCGPYPYFKKEFSAYNCIFHTLKNVRFDLIHENDFVILGGGGMLDCSNFFTETIDKILSKCRHVIGWGLGHNQHYVGTVLYETDIAYIDLSRFELAGIRDYGYAENERYCPCVSCMMEGLESQYAIKRRIGVISHHQFLIDDFKDFDHITNSFAIEDVLRFIGESEIIITNTYHCMYWSTLMGKKVILFQIFSNKFQYFKYPPVFYSGDLEADIKKTHRYPESLEECRTINRAFAAEVIAMISKKG